MEQRTYEMPYTAPDDDIRELLDRIRNSKQYKNAKTVYVKLLFGDVRTNAAQDMVDYVCKYLPKAKTIGMSLTLFAQKYDGVPFVRMSVIFFESSNVEIVYHDDTPKCFMTAGNIVNEELKSIKNTMI